MCLRVRKKNWLVAVFTKPMVAKKDIECYKIYNIREGNKLQSFVQGVIYDRDKPLPKVDLGAERYGKKISIHEGYHSYVNEPEGHRGVFKCIGSKYYLGDYNSHNDAYASNQLIIVEQIR